MVKSLQLFLKLEDSTEEICKRILNLYKTIKKFTMKKNRLMIALMFSAGLLMGACGSNESKTTEAEAPKVAEQVVNTTHPYICPMNCENSASMEPGQCKVCGMDLVKNPNYVSTAADSTATADTMQMQEGSKTEGHDEEGHEGHNH